MVFEMEDMMIYVKDNVERIVGNEEMAKKLEAKGFKKTGEKAAPSLIPQEPKRRRRRAKAEAEETA